MSGLTQIEQDAMKAVISISRKMKDQREIDWEQRRYEIARDVLAAFMSNSCDNVYSGTPEKQSKDAVLYADALINELKGGSK